MAGPWFIGSDIYRQTSIGRRHPLAIPRVSAVIDLCGALGWLKDGYIDSPVATCADLARYHDPAYIEAVRAAEVAQAVTPEQRARYNLGTIEAPVYEAMFRRPATAAGAALRAADLVAEGGVVFTPASGTHHGRRARASGFCVFNDPVLALLRLLDLGLARVLYVDIDAHHGDGVEDAFAGDARVLTVSVHEDGRWPGSGAAGERAGGSARNLPVPAGFNDSEMAYVLAHAILPLAETFAPEAIILQAGADSLDDDPMSRLGLSNRAHRAVVEALMPLSPRLIVTGGGGYNPWAVARCWTGVWAALAGRAVPERLPEEAQAVLREVRWRRAPSPPEHWLASLADAPREGPVRDAVRAVCAEAMAPPRPDQARRLLA